MRAQRVPEARAAYEWHGTGPQVALSAHEATLQRCSEGHGDTAALLEGLRKPPAPTTPPRGSMVRASLEAQQEEVSQAKPAAHMRVWRPGRACPSQNCQQASIAATWV